MATTEKTHYHIHWTRPPKLDWERFSTPEEAKQIAEQLAGPGEIYSIEGFGETCERCAKLGGQNNRTGKPR